MNWNTLLGTGSRSCTHTVTPPPPQKKSVLRMWILFSWVGFRLQSAQFCKSPLNLGEKLDQSMDEYVLDFDIRSALLTSRETLTCSEKLRL